MNNISNIDQNINSNFFKQIGLKKDNEDEIMKMTPETYANFLEINMETL